MDQKDKKYLQLTLCSCSMLRKSARIITQFYDGSLREAGIKPTQFFILGSLANTGPVPLTQLADEIGLDRTGLTRTLNVLDRNGWVHIKPGEEDSRQRVVSLSEKGYEQLDRAIPYWQVAQNKIIKEMGKDVMGGLRQILGNMNAATME